MPGRVRITDVSPRDGLQNEPGLIPTADKVRLVELLSRTGVDEVEVTSFVSPKWVPQLGDAAEVIAALRKPPPGGRGLGVGAGDQQSPWRSPARSELTLQRARTLRRNMTGPENILWGLIRNRQLMGAKFRRQHPFGPYILDFFCRERLLCVELDGRSHASSDDHDTQRDRYLADNGVRTLRITNDRLLEAPESVASDIRRAIDFLPSTGSPRPSLQSHNPYSERVVLSALVPNSLGLQGVLDANRSAQHEVISKVAVFTAASEEFSLRNTNASIAQTLDRFRPVIAASRAEGLATRGYISCVIACPFAGPIDPEIVADVARRLLDLGVEEIDLGDTIGAGTPTSVETLIRAVGRVCPPLAHPQPPPSGRGLLTLHLHDTFHRAADCVKAALDLGIRSFDGSVAGLGGCPYASTPGKRAPGNISTELLVRTIEDAGYETGVDHDKLKEAAAFATSIVARSRAGGAA